MPKFFLLLFIDNEVGLISGARGLADGGGLGEGE